MGIAITLREPEDEAVATEPAAVVIGITDIFFLFLLNEGAYITFNIHFVDTVEVMTTLIVFKANGVRVLTPLRAVEGILIGDKVGIWREGTACSYLVGRLLSKFITGLGILLFVKNWLELVGR